MAEAEHYLIQNLKIKSTEFIETFKKHVKPSPRKIKHQNTTKKRASRKSSISKRRSISQRNSLFKKKRNSISKQKRSQFQKPKLKNIENEGFNGSVIKLKELESEEILPKNEDALTSVKKDDKEEKINKKEEEEFALEYFADDEVNLKLMQDNNQHYFYEPYDVNFSIQQYAEFFFIHFLALGIIGPFINIYTVFFRKNKKLMSNLLFSRVSFFFFVQYFTWTVNVFGVYLNWQYDAKIMDFNAGYLIMLLILVKSSVIGGKYATYPGMKIKRIKESKLTAKELNQEVMLFSWVSQTENIIKRETSYSVLRNEIDEDCFSIEFLGKLSLEREKELEQAENEGKAKSKTSGRRRKFKGTLIFETLVQKFNKHHSTVLNIELKVMAIVLIIFYTLGPAFIRISFDQPFHGTCLVEQVTFYLILMSNITLVMTLCIFFHSAKKDMLRKCFVLKQLGMMISSKKNKVYTATKKYLPTVCIIDPVSLKNWLDLRRMAMDYGKKFFVRHQIFVFVMSFVWIHNLVLVIAINFIQITESESFFIELRKLQIFMAINFIPCYYMFFNLLFRVAAINEEFGRHLKVLKENKKIFNDILCSKSFYLESFENNPTKTLQWKYVHEIKKRSRNCSYEEYLENLIKATNDCIEEVEHEEKFNSLEVLGFAIQKTSVTKLLLAFISISVTAYEVLKK